MHTALKEVNGIETGYFQYDRNLATNSKQKDNEPGKKSKWFIWSV